MFYSGHCVSPYLPNHPSSPLSPLSHSPPSPAACPHINSATIPPTLFSGSLATLFINLTLHPLSSLLFPHFLLYHQESSRTILRWEKKISKSFPYSIVAFIFTVPERGKVVFQPDQLSMSRCSAVESDQYVMDIVRGRCVCVCVCAYV